MTKEYPTSPKQQIREAIKTLSVAADELHLDITPAVTALSDMGIIAVPALLELLTNDAEMTRLHAQRALELFINKRHGFIPGQGFPSPKDEQAARNEWQGNGNYDYNADEQSRAASIAKWQQWLDSVEE